MVVCSSPLNVVKGQYAELRLRFNTTDLPESYSSPDMETKLRDEVKSVIQTYLVRSISRASVEIESISLSPENVSSELRKRQQNQQGVLLVDVNILPASLSQHDIESVKNVGDVWTMLALERSNLIERSTLSVLL